MSTSITSAPVLPPLSSSVGNLPPFDPTKAPPPGQPPLGGLPPDFADSLTMSQAADAQQLPSPQDLLMMLMQKMFEDEQKRDKTERCTDAAGAAAAAGTAITGIVQTASTIYG